VIVLGVVWAFVKRWWKWIAGLAGAAVLVVVLWDYIVWILAALGVGWGLWKAATVDPADDDKRSVDNLAAIDRRKAAKEKARAVAGTGTVDDVAARINARKAKR